ncbi:hypothetical protein [Kineosporia succinea]|uniref:Uncharacterized protein n=1 Tax=Kineosporia succinea TaxID=84632 RepID=A0ABT9NXZ1_9ACTN|nr:hypothetical protein [Kineosporia succinea]MDP9824865.1 hypothetical protein [Kineosporia succinea]
MTVNMATGAASAGRHLAPPDDIHQEQAAPDDLVTRLLCAACYLHDDIADAAQTHLLTPSRRALTPNWEVDVVALARHAARAQGLRTSRDRWLNTELFYVAGIAVLGLILTLSGVFNLFQFVLFVLFLLFCAYWAAAGIVWFGLRSARRAAISVARDPGEDPPPPLRRRSTEEALYDLNHCNAVLYRSDAAPFVGSGVKLDTWQMTLDISRRSEAGGPGITGADLQIALLELLPGRISPRPSGHHRLYVRGGQGALSVDLYRQGPLEPRLDMDEVLNWRRPSTVVHAATLWPYFDRRDESARTYTCFQQSALGGQVVVSLFVRAWVANQTLFVEGQVYALRPLHPQLYEVNDLDTSSGAELRELGPIALHDATALLLNAPSEVLKKARAARLRAANASEADAEIEHRRDVDFGAVKSLREQVTNFDLGEHFAAADEEVYYQAFVRRTMECIGIFLQTRGVDQAEFAGQSADIISHTNENARGIYGAASGA